MDEAHTPALKCWVGSVYKLFTIAVGCPVTTFSGLYSFFAMRVRKTHYPLHLLSIPRKGRREDDGEQKEEAQVGGRSQHEYSSHHFARPHTLGSFCQFLSSRQQGGFLRMGSITKDLGRRYRPRIPLAYFQRAASKLRIFPLERRRGWRICRISRRRWYCEYLGYKSRYNYRVRSYIPIITSPQHQEAPRSNHWRLRDREKLSPALFLRRE